MTVECGEDMPMVDMCMVRHGSLRVGYVNDIGINTRLQATVLLVSSIQYYNAGKLRA